MTERMSSEEAEALLLEHQMQEGDTCVICRSCADLLDARRERDTRIAQLAECYRLTGADPDGNEDWRLADYAVDEVRQLRADYDADCDREWKSITATHATPGEEK